MSEAIKKSLVEEVSRLSAKLSHIHNQIEILIEESKELSIDLQSAVDRLKDYHLSPQELEKGITLENPPYNEVGGRFIDLDKE